MQSIYNYITDKNHFWGTQCCSYSVVAIHNTCNAISHVNSSVILNEYMPKRERERERERE